MKDGSILTGLTVALGHCDAFKRLVGDQFSISLLSGAILVSRVHWQSIIAFQSGSVMWMQRADPYDLTP